MPVFRVEKSRDYTTMSNYHLRDKNLSLKAKGLLSQILSLPDDWNYSVSGLAAINKESRDSIRTAVNELEYHGYIVRHRIRSDDGKLGDMEYVVYERPSPKSVTVEAVQSSSVSGNPVLDFPTQVISAQDKPMLEDSTQLSTESQITDKEKTEKKNEEKRTYGNFRNVRLSDSDMEKLKTAFPNDYGQRIERLSEYIESSGRKYNNHYLTICQWARRDNEAAQKTVNSRKFENYECMEGESY